MIEELPIESGPKGKEENKSVGKCDCKKFIAGITLVAILASILIFSVSLVSFPADSDQHCCHMCGCDTGDSDISSASEALVLLTSYITSDDCDFNPLLGSTGCYDDHTLFACNV